MIAILQRREACNEAAQTCNCLPHLFYADMLGFAESPYLAVDEAGSEQLARFQTDGGRTLRDSPARVLEIC